MGFDNECILNIQSLAGEYFCPVCRLLVYPNEALQSQCTHLYCKPCLTYIVSTSRACPYDGYLVTEADSKPLAETNKALAETIGNIPVHCLYHRSGCQWQGSLSSCVSHCVTCAFGNSPVVCNRCAVHIVHRQVQDHALTCSGAQAQPQPGVAGGDQAQPAVVPGNDANQQAQAIAEQYYQQQQQQYQQYYQQQKQNVIASNATGQPVAAPNLQAPAINQVTPQQQSYPQQFYQQQKNVMASNATGQPAAAPNLQAPAINQVTPQQQSYPQQFYQQQKNVMASNATGQPAAAPNLQAPSINQVTPQQQSYPQQFYQQQKNVIASNATGQPAAVINQVTAQQQQHSYPQSQPYAQYQQPQAQQQVQMHYPPSLAQNPAMTAHPSEPQTQFASNPIAQRPQQVLTVPVQQQQQHSVQRPYFQQRPVQQLRPVGMPHSFPHVRPQFPQNPVGRPSMPGHGVQPQPHSQFLGGLSRPVYHQDSIPRAPGQNQSRAISSPAISAKVDSGSKPAVVAAAQAENSGSVVKPVDSGNKEQASTIKSKENEEPIKQEGDVENKLNHSNVGESREVVDDEKKDALEEGLEKNKQPAMTVIEKKTTENGSHEQHEGQDGNLVNDSSIRGSENGLQRESIASTEIQDGCPEHPHQTLDQGNHQPLAYHHGPTSVPLPPPPPAFDSRAGTMARSTNQNQRPFFMDARRQPNPAFPGSLEHGKLGPNMKGASSFDPMLPLGPRREFPNLQAERLNSFPTGPNLHMPDRVELLHDMKRFPRPGSVPSIFLPRHDVGPSSYAGERRVVRHEDPFGRTEPNHLDFLDRRHFDGLASRSLGREHLGMSLRGFPRPDLDEIHGRELRRLGNPFPGSFSESRFSLLPSHLRRSEFEAPGRMGLGDRFRNDVIGHDGFSSHPRGFERMGHHNMYDDFHLREPVGFAAPSLHARTIDIGRSAIDSFRGGDRPRFPSLGEPGFSSNLSLHGFPNDVGVTTVKGELGFDNKRKAPTIGWCRICKVDCETVEGLDLHSQTREHQKMAMDVVATIKNNVKKKKIKIGEQSSPRDASKPKNSGNGEDVGKN